MVVSYFDETCFRYGETLTDFDQVNVFNDADAFLMRKQGIPYASECSKRKVSRVANLNARTTCAGINIYTMDPRNRIVRKLLNFNQINVYNGENTIPLRIDEHVSGAIYNVGQLCSFESAIMLKYYAINHDDVYITQHLHAFVRKHFNDGRAWFNNLQVGIIENNMKELIYNGEIINIPPLEFASETIEC